MDLSKLSRLLELFQFQCFHFGVLMHVHVFRLKNWFSLYNRLYILMFWLQDKTLYLVGSHYNVMLVVTKAN